MSITSQMQALLDVARCAVALTHMGEVDGKVIVGPVGWTQLQSALEALYKPDANGMVVL